MKTKYQTLIAKKLSEFPDYKDLTKESKYATLMNSNVGHLRDPDLSLAAPAGTISPLSTIKDLVIQGAMSPESDIRFYKPAKKMSYDVPTDEASSPTIGGLSMLSRDILKSEIGSEILKRKLDPASQLANPKDLSIRILKSDDARGEYNPSTGQIAVMQGLSPQEFAGTLAHEVGHKRKAQELWQEGSKKGTYAQKILSGAPVGFTSEYAQIPEENSVQVDKLLNTFRHHHGKLNETPWEVETLKNIKEKNMLAEPMTKELTASQKEKYLKSIKKIKDVEKFDKKMKQLMAE